MENVSLKLESTIARQVEKAMHAHHYSTKTEFIRDAIRSRLIEIKKVVFEEEAAARHEHDHPDEETSKEAMEALLKAHDEKKFTGVH